MKLIVPIVFAALLLGACQAIWDDSETDRVRFVELDWVDESVDPVTHLTLEPATCLLNANDERVVRGELLFSSPLLLGGQAAKAGLSCAACHRNGRGNPDFVLTGISGSPGSADVTNGFFSSARADRVFNPVAIPDLASREGQIRIDREENGELELFLSAQIIEEFSGLKPDASAVSDLAAYIRALDDKGCDPKGMKEQTWRDDIVLIEAGIAYVISNPGEPSEAYINAIRAALGRISNRFGHPSTRIVQERLERLSLMLMSSASLNWEDVELDTLEALLLENEPFSFYNREQIEALFD